MRRAEYKEFPLAARPPGVSRQSWLYAEIRTAILAGRLTAGTRVPTSRDLAHQAGVSRGTVLAVFDQLTAEGFLTGVVGKGTFVSGDLPKPAGTVTGASDAFAVNTDRLSRSGSLLSKSPFALAGRPLAARPFRPNQPDLTAFPFAVWNRISARRSRLSQRTMLADGDAHGYYPLRQSIAEHLRFSMRINCRAEHIVILGSVQQLLDLVVRLLLDPGDRVWLEDPGYAGARQIFIAAGANVVGIPVDSKGLDVAAGLRLAPDARLAYVTAGRQSPLGMPLALERRLALLNWAHQSGAFLIEDDYDSEFRYCGSPLAAMKSLDHGERVIYAGSFSKLLFPSLRLSYAVLPEWLVRHFACALSLTARHIALLPQVVLHEFIAEGHFGRHLQSMKALYGERAAALEESAGRHLDGLLSVLPITNGIDATAFLPECSDDSVIARSARRAGIEVNPLSAYAIDHPAPSGLVLGFASFDRRMIDAGINALGAVIERGLAKNRSSG